MATNNGRNNKGQFPIGSVIKLEFTPPAGSGWLECDASVVSQTTYADLYSLVGFDNEGTPDVTEICGGLTAGQSRYPHIIMWHPSTNYVALASDFTSGKIQICSFNGSVLTKVEDANSGNSNWDCDWHPDGDYLTITDSGGYLKVYSWNGTDTLVEVESINLGNNNQGCSWHPDGDYLASFSGNYLKVYSWNGTDTLTEVESINLGAVKQYNVCKWSNNGDYFVAVCNVVNAGIRVYGWNGSDTLTLKDTYDVDDAFSFSWSLDDDFIFMAANAAAVKTLYVFSFNGTDLALVDDIDYGATYGCSACISRGGNYLFVVTMDQTGTPTTQYIKTYSINLSTGELAEVDSVSLASSEGRISVSVNYTNKYIIYAQYHETSADLIHAASTDLVSCDYRTNFVLPTVADNIIRGL